MLSARETSLIALLLVVLMFGMGSTLTWQRFRELARSPRAFLIGTASQFGWMPLVAFAIAKVLELPTLPAVGLIVMGTCPGGATSNLFAHLARADIALSISMTAASKLIGIVMMPICLYIYARPFTGTAFPIPYGDIVKTLVVLLVPVVIAMALRQKFGVRFERAAERLGSLAGILVLLTLIALTVSRNAHMFETVPFNVYLAAGLLGSIGMLLGSLVARAARLPVEQRRTVSFETGIQNGPLCFAILLMAFPTATQLEILTLPLLYSLFVMIEAACVTVVYRTLDARALTLRATSAERTSA